VRAMIAVGTCGFCEAHSKYYRDFDAIEIQQTFYRILQEKTLRRWREEAPERLHLFNQGVSGGNASP
jgi:uncharacterized protein YecE (DUF72 family)